MMINLTPTEVVAALGVLLALSMMWRSGTRRGRRRTDAAFGASRVASLAGHLLGWTAVTTGGVTGDDYTRAHRGDPSRSRTRRRISRRRGGHSAATTRVAGGVVATLTARPPGAEKPRPRGAGRQGRRRHHHLHTVAVHQSGRAGQRAGRAGLAALGDRPGLPGR